MRKLFTLGIIATLALGLSGCIEANPPENLEKEDPVVVEETVVETEIKDTTDYTYDKTTGELTAVEDGTVLYENPNHPNMVLHVLGLDGDKLIVFETGNDNSPGPGFIHEVWVSETVAKDLYFLDVTDPEEGLNSYTVPQYKIDKESVLLDYYSVYDVLLYSTEGVDVEVTSDKTAFDYTAAQLESMADECGTAYEEGYFDDLVETYANTPKFTYEFKYDGESQDPDTYTVTVLVDRMEYGTDLDAVKADFDQCFAGGDMYPVDVAYNHIIFESSCGSGFDDGSGLPNGCADVKEVVEPTLEVNPEVAFI